MNAVDVRKCDGPVVTCDFQTQRSRARRGEEGAGRLASRFFSSFFAHVQLISLCLTVSVAWRGLFAFRPFGPSIFQLMPCWILRCGPKGRKANKRCHFPLASLPRSRSFGYLRQSTTCTWSPDVTPQAKRRDARPRILVGLRLSDGVESSRRLYIPHMRGRASAAFRLRQETEGTRVSC